jgi:hypothetical protein
VWLLFTHVYFGIFIYYPFCHSGSTRFSLLCPSLIPLPKEGLSSFTSFLIFLGANKIFYHVVRTSSAFGIGKDAFHAQNQCHHYQSIKALLVNALLECHQVRQISWAQRQAPIPTWSSQKPLRRHCGSSRCTSIQEALPLSLALHSPTEI